MSDRKIAKIIQIVPVTGITSLYKQDSGEILESRAQLAALDDEGNVFLLEFDSAGTINEPRTLSNFIKHIFK